MLVLNADAIYVRSIRNASGEVLHEISVLTFREMAMNLPTHATEWQKVFMVGVC